MNRQQKISRSSLPCSEFLNLSSKALPKLITSLQYGLDNSFIFHKNQTRDSLNIVAMADSNAKSGSSHASDYVKSVASTLANGKYSDLTITCKGEIFKVHRMVVCLQSKPLAAHIDGAFRVSIQDSISKYKQVSHPIQEAMTGVIDLADDEPATVANMIDYFYKGDYGKGPDDLDYWHPLMLITHTRACTKASHVNFPFQTAK